MSTSYSRSPPQSLTTGQWPRSSMSSTQRTLLSSPKQSTSRHSWTSCKSFAGPRSRSTGSLSLLTSLCPPHPSRSPTSRSPPPPPPMPNPPPLHPYLPSATPPSPRPPSCPLSNAGAATLAVLGHPPFLFEQPVIVIVIIVAPFRVCVVVVSPSLHSLLSPLLSLLTCFCLSLCRSRQLLIP